MKQIIFFCILFLINIACVQTEILEGPEQMKTVTVWSSDLKLNYDRLSSDEKKTNKYNEPEENYNFPERVISLDTEILLEKELVLEEVSSEDMEILLAKTLEKKIITDEKRTKKVVEISSLDIQDESQWKNTSKNTKWLIVLAAFTSFGGFFNSFAKRKYKKDKVTEE